MHIVVEVCPDCGEMNGTWVKGERHAPQECPHCPLRRGKRPMMQIGYVVENAKGSGGP